MSINKVMPTSGSVLVVGVKSISEGGTGATSKEAAAVNLGAVASADLNKAYGFLGMDANGLIPSARIRALNDVTIKGPTSLRGGEVGTYVITNYNVLRAYVVTAESGSVTQVGDTITWTAPATPTSRDGFTINGRYVPVVVRKSTSGGTLITYPTQDATDIPVGLNVTTGPFASALQELSTTAVALSVATQSGSIPVGDGTFTMPTDTISVTFTGSGSEGPSARKFAAQSSDFLRTKFTETGTAHTYATQSITPGTTDSDIVPAMVHVWNQADQSDKVPIYLSGSVSITENDQTGKATIVATYHDSGLGVTIEFTGVVDYTPATSNPVGATTVTYHGGQPVEWTSATASSQNFEIQSNDLAFDYHNANTLRYVASIRHDSTLTIPGGAKIVVIQAPANATSVIVEYEGGEFIAAGGKQISIPVGTAKTMRVMGSFAATNASGTVSVSYMAENPQMNNAYYLTLKNKTASRQISAGNRTNSGYPINARNITFTGKGTGLNTDTTIPWFEQDAISLKQGGVFQYTVDHASSINLHPDNAVPIDDPDSGISTVVAAPPTIYGDGVGRFSGYGTNSGAPVFGPKQSFEMPMTPHQFNHTETGTPALMISNIPTTIPAVYKMRDSVGNVTYQKTQLILESPAKVTGFSGNSPQYTLTYRSLTHPNVAVVYRVSEVSLTRLRTNGLPSIPSRVITSDGNAYDFPGSTNSTAPVEHSHVWGSMPKVGGGALFAPQTNSYGLTNQSNIYSSNYVWEYYEYGEVVKSSAVASNRGIRLSVPDNDPYLDYVEIYANDANGQLVIGQMLARVYPGDSLSVDSGNLTSVSVVPFFNASQRDATATVLLEELGVAEAHLSTDWEISRSSALTPATPLQISQSVLAVAAKYVDVSFAQGITDRVFDQNIFDVKFRGQGGNGGSSTGSDTRVFGFSGTMTKTSASTIPENDVMFPGYFTYAQTWIWGNYISNFSDYRIDAWENVAIFSWVNYQVSNRQTGGVITMRLPSQMQYCIQTYTGGEKDMYNYRSSNVVLAKVYIDTNGELVMMFTFSGHEGNVDQYNVTYRGSVTLPVISGAYTPGANSTGTASTVVGSASAKSYRSTPGLTSTTAPSGTEIPETVGHDTTSITVGVVNTVTTLGIQSRYAGSTTGKITFKPSGAVGFLPDDAVDAATLESDGSVTFKGNGTTINGHTILSSSRATDPDDSTVDVLKYTMNHVNGSFVYVAKLQRTAVNTTTNTIATRTSYDSTTGDGVKLVVFTGGGYTFTYSFRITNVAARNVNVNFPGGVGGVSTPVDWASYGPGPMTVTVTNANDLWGRYFTFSDTDAVGSIPAAAGSFKVAVDSVVLTKVEVTYEGKTYVVMRGESKTIDVGASLTFTVKAYMAGDALSAGVTVTYYDQGNQMFANPLRRSLGDMLALRVWSQTGLLEDTDYYVRARHCGVSTGYASWSDVVHFTTGADVAVTPATGPDGSTTYTRGAVVFVAAHGVVGSDIPTTVQHTTETIDVTLSSALWVKRSGNVTWSAVSRTGAWPASVTLATSATELSTDAGFPAVYDLGTEKAYLSQSWVEYINGVRYQYGKFTKADGTAVYRFPTTAHSDMHTTLHFVRTIYTNPTAEGPQLVRYRNDVTNAYLDYEYQATL